jgi:arylsulfatase A-like enzyme
MTSPRRTGLAFLGLALLAAALLWSLRGGGSAPSAPAAGPPPGIVLFCFDTLRRDGAVGAKDGTPWMPVLAEFARQATDFEDAVSSSAWTAPSVATLLTGLLPFHHGVEGEGQSLLPAVATIAERLKAHGWSTAAFTGGGWLVPDRGFAQGFDLFSAGFDDAPPDGGPERLVARWKQARPSDAPFFLFLHTYAPHDPYGARAKEEAASGEVDPDEVAFGREVRAMLERGEAVLPDAVRKRLLLSSVLDGRARTSYGQALGRPLAFEALRQSLRWLDEGLPKDPEREEVFARMRAAYFDGLAHADAVFRRTREALADLPEGTVWVVLSDHGEAFGEHGTAMHGRWLHDEFVRVPLLVRAPGRLEAGRRVRGSCGIVDVASTCLDLAGAPPALALHGRSLLPLARGQAGGHPVLGQEVREDMVGAGLAGTVQLSVRTEAAKLLVDVDPRRKEVRETLFDLGADPAEATPLPAERLDRFGPAFADGAARVRALARERAGVR